MVITVVDVLQKTTNLSFSRSVFKDDIGKVASWLYSHGKSLYSVILVYCFVTFLLTFPSSLPKLPNNYYNYNFTSRTAIFLCGCLNIFIINYSY